MRLFFKPRMDFFITFIVFTISGVGVSASCYAQSNEAYLDALQDEASNLSLDNGSTVKKTLEFNPTSPNKKIPTSTLIAESGLPAGLDFNGFIATLKANYFGTYIFIKRLRNEQKNEVFTFYQSNNDPQAIRLQVLIISKKN